MFLFTLGLSVAKTSSEGLCCWILYWKGLRLWKLTQSMKFCFWAFWTTELRDEVSQKLWSFKCFGLWLSMKNETTGIDLTKESVSVGVWDEKCVTLMNRSAAKQSKTLIHKIQRHYRSRLIASNWNSERNVMWW